MKGVYHTTHIKVNPYREVVGVKREGLGCLNSSQKRVNWKSEHFKRAGTTFILWKVKMLQSAILGPIETRLVRLNQCNFLSQSVVAMFCHFLHKTFKNTFDEIS